MRIHHARAKLVARQGNADTMRAKRAYTPTSRNQIMSQPTQNQARRRFLKLAVVGAAIAPIAAVLLPRLGFAADLPHLTADDPTAKALAYTDNATTATANAAYKAGSECANCQLYTGKAGDEYGPCALFPGKSVHAKGWCSGYSKKA
jgi:hypothetical protein